MITGKYIYKRYGTVEVLKGVDLGINKGEVVSIVGPSGSGKSTLLHILGTLDKADMGEVDINGVRAGNTCNQIIPSISWIKRFFNYILDSVFIGFLAYGIVILSGSDIPFYGAFRGFSWIALLYTFITTIVYYTLSEGLMGRTFAKYITQTKVIVQADSSKPSLTDSLLRTFCRFIPFEAFSFFSKQPIGWHDEISGTLVVDGKIPYQKKIKNSLTGKKLAAFRNKHIGFVFQFHHLLPEFTALENVSIPGWLAGRKKAEVKEKAIELLNILGLSHRMENKPNEMSGGEQQRVAVARALINNPDIVFADEPTGNLDSANAKELHQLFFDLRNKFNQTFLIVTHNEELAKLSDRILYMKDGKIV